MSNPENFAWGCGGNGGSKKPPIEPEPVMYGMVAGAGSCTASEQKPRLERLEDWELMLYTEKEQLQDRFDKLGKFIDSNHYRTLKTTECVLIESQYIAMCNYLNALKWRIELAEKRIKDTTP